MGKKSVVHALCSIIAFVLAGCVTPEPEYIDEQDVTGYIPVYDAPTATEIMMTSARSIENPGKIYVYGKYLLVNEIKKGIHVFDNTNPAEPLPVGFLQVLGNTDMAIKDGQLYADHMGNLVALTVNDFGSVEEKGRLPLKTWDLGIPPPAGYYFECVDPAKGVVVSWTNAELHNPQCYALQ
jgi:hypothetical protein